MCACVYVCVCVCVCVRGCVWESPNFYNFTPCCLPMGWLRLVGSLKLQVSLAEYSLFYRALLQKRPMILRSLLIVANSYYECFCSLTLWGSIRHSLSGFMRHTLWGTESHIHMTRTHMTHTHKTHTHTLYEAYSMRHRVSHSHDSHSHDSHSQDSHSHTLWGILYGA